MPLAAAFQWEHAHHIDQQILEHVMCSADGWLETGTTLERVPTESRLPASSSAARGGLVRQRRCSSPKRFSMLKCIRTSRRLSAAVAAPILRAAITSSHLKPSSTSPKSIALFEEANHRHSAIVSTTERITSPEDVRALCSTTGSGTRAEVQPVD